MCVSTTVCNGPLINPAHSKLLCSAHIHIHMRIYIKKHPQITIYGKQLKVSFMGMYVQSNASFIIYVFGKPTVV